MAHPYQKYREEKVARAAAKERVRGYAGGGKVHADKAQDVKLMRQMIRQEEAKEHRADGGRLTGGAESGMGRLQLTRRARG